MKIKKTKRGFQKVEFKDSNNLTCSLQISSSAGTDRIWLGLDNADIQEFYPSYIIHILFVEISIFTEIPRN